MVIKLIRSKNKCEGQCITMKETAMGMLRFPLEETAGKPFFMPISLDRAKKTARRKIATGRCARVFGFAECFLTVCHKRSFKYVVLADMEFGRQYFYGAACNGGMRRTCSVLLTASVIRKANSFAC